MGRKPRVDRSPEEKWQIVQEGLKSGNVSESAGGRLGGEAQGRLPKLRSGPRAAVISPRCQEWRCDASGVWRGGSGEPTNRTPREAFLSFAAVLKNEALTV